MEGRLHFASYGDPYFDATVNQVVEFELPAGVRRLTASVNGIDAEIVGYAVATFDGDGVRQVQLIASLAEAEDIQIDESSELTDEEITPLQVRLNDIARKEFEPAVAVPRLERLNVQAGYAQSAFNYLLIACRLQSRGSFSEVSEMFWPLMKELEELMEERDRVMVPGLPAEQMRVLAPHLLFAAKIPQIGEEGSITVPGPLLRFSFDAGCRIADAMKVKKSELTTSAVLARLQREVERGLAAMKK